MGSSMVKLFGLSNRIDQSTSSSSREDGIYHERQVKELCAMHALNNLLQEEYFTQKSLDEICHELDPSHGIFNAHRSMFGTGNYDINVIMVALKRKGYEVVWFDKRRDVDELDLEHIEGFILNKPTDYKLGGIFPVSFNRKHWVTIRSIKKQGGLYYNLDSKLKNPREIGEASKLMEFLQEQLEDKDKELLLVVTNQVEQSSSWKLKKPNSSDNSVTPPNSSSDIKMDG